MTLMKFKGVNLELYSVDYFPVETPLGQISLVIRQVNGGRYTLTAPNQNKEACDFIAQAFNGIIMGITQVGYLDLDSIIDVGVKFIARETQKNIPENQRLLVKESFVPKVNQQPQNSARLVVFSKLSDGNIRLAVVEGPLHVKHMVTQTKESYKFDLELMNTRNTFSVDTPKITIAFDGKMDNYLIKETCGVIVQQVDVLLNHYSKTGYIDLNTLLHSAMISIPRYGVLSCEFLDRSPSAKLKP